MLVLTRETGESVWIGQNVRVTVVRVKGGQVKLGIEAPHDVPVLRDELAEDLPEPPHE
ncbi:MULTISPECIES: carbon storage regulator [unclassified Thioalkalivibrio]|uniref:carbon storage regulator n=1 Tax=unclassified Thioalkalivibrio TaxID=2621013 RepID=UPI0003616317|nr:MULTISPECIES: carbon storage regulator [unclassified Thioalkalivibrio]